MAQGKEPEEKLTLVESLNRQRKGLAQEWYGE